MKKLLLLSTVLLGAVSATQAGVHLNFGFGLPLPPLPFVVESGRCEPFYAPPVCAPVVVCPPRVVITPRPIYYPYRYGYRYDSYRRGYDGRRYDYDRRGHNDHRRSDRSHGYRR